MSDGSLRTGPSFVRLENLTSKSMMRNLKVTSRDEARNWSSACAVDKEGTRY